jgi:hypothetical protein
MNTQITAYTANESHLPYLIGLGRTYYPTNHHALNENFLKWLYLDNPTGSATLIVAHENNIWIGIVVLIPVMLEFSSLQQKACYAVNVLTHPVHRGKKLFVKMIQYTKELLSRKNTWLLGHPNTHALPGWNRQDMKFRDPLCLYLAKFRLPFSPLRIKRINSLEKLQLISPDFWATLSNRSDIHVKYTPEFIEWRYLKAPHQKYFVSTVEKHGKLVGIIVTRNFKSCVDLCVDFIAPLDNIGNILSSTNKPTLIMHSGLGHTGDEIKKGSWKLPVKRQFPFFVTTWTDESALDMTGITLAASDF